MHLCFQGEEGEDVSLEMGMAWERTEDVNCVPAFINKLRDSSALAALNSSLNCSINASFAQQRRPNRRRSAFILFYLMLVLRCLTHIRRYAHIYLSCLYSFVCVCVYAVFLKSNLIYDIYLSWGGCV